MCARYNWFLLGGVLRMLHIMVHWEREIVQFRREGGTSCGPFNEWRRAKRDYFLIYFFFFTLHRLHLPLSMPNCWEGVGGQWHPFFVLLQARLVGATQFRDPDVYTLKSRWNSFTGFAFMSWVIDAIWPPRLTNLHSSNKLLCMLMSHAHSVVHLPYLLIFPSSPIAEKISNPLASGIRLVFLSSFPSSSSIYNVFFVRDARSGKKANGNNPSFFSRDFEKGNWFVVTDLVWTWLFATRMGKYWR